MYKSYSYSNMPVPVKKRGEEKKQPPQRPRGEEEEKDTKLSCENKQDDKQCSFLDNLETDDIVLIVVALVLLMDDCDDKLLLLAVAYLLFSEWI